MIRTLLAVIHSGFWCGAAVVTLIFFPRKTDFVLRNYAQRFWSKPLLKWIVRAKVEVEVSKEAQKLFSKNEGAVLMANHSSFLDINACFATCPTPIVFLAKASLRKVPLLGGANARVGTVFVERGNKESALNSIKTLVSTVQGGRSVVVFPEGTRSVDGKLKAFKKGGFHLSVQAKAPVVPVYIEGTFDRLPPKAFRIRRLSAPIVVKYGDPIYSDNVEELRDLTYNSICELRG